MYTHGEKHHSPDGPSAIAEDSAADAYHIDSYKLNHWMNARKIDEIALGERLGLTQTDIDALRKGLKQNVELSTARKLAAALQIEVFQIARKEHPNEEFVLWTKDDIEATRFEIHRDGIHFYNYYQLPGPYGEVKPVILDILCPKDRLPALNNGHIEPALTVNLGPGPIIGRWEDGEEGPVSDVLASSDSNFLPWIVGESYIEPPYQKHSYALASDRPARSARPGFGQRFELQRRGER